MSIDLGHKCIPNPFCISIILSNYAKGIRRGQLNSKYLFDIFKYPKKKMYEKHQLYYYGTLMVPQVGLFSFVFWET